MLALFDPHLCGQNIVFHENMETARVGLYEGASEVTGKGWVDRFYPHTVKAGHAGGQAAAVSAGSCLSQLGELPAYCQGVGRQR